jgi:CRISPR-associated endonuclease/helicase Cas3
MTPTHWPRELDSILAKSADRGGQTLAEHTWDVLEKLAALHQLRPALPELARMPRLWHCLFWTCLLHDFGKAARGFQKMLKDKEPWKHRHEVLSLACFDWLAAGLSQEERLGIVAAIVSHHRDAGEIQQKYDDVDPDPLVPLLAELEPEIVSKLWHWVDGCAADWMTALGFSAEEVQPIPLMPHDQAVALVVEQGVPRVRALLRTYGRWVDDLGRSQPITQKVFAVLLRGLTTTADHMASSSMKDVPAPIWEYWESLARRKFQSPEPPVYGHQRACAGHSGRSALLVAPTGSGKTEAALYWALGDGSKSVPRLFYALPYQASMNAMFERLKKDFGAAAIGLQHGRALQALYLRLMDQEQPIKMDREKEARKAAKERANWEQNLNTLHARPLKVFSPYQMLKAAFQLRGFEGMLTDYAQAAFIFDEIHAYEPKRLALILALVKYLRQHYQARFLVMSATFPQLIREKLSDALALDLKEDLISADAAVFEQFRRHRLHLLSGGLLEDGIPQIVAEVQAGKKVLACANTVRRAQEVRNVLLKAGLRREQVVLIHSRFILKDRTRLEQEVMRRSEIGATSEPFVLVATQVVEVSLNIDLDTIYTDPAPLEALLQRFGRVNRQGKKQICPVHVFRQPDDGQYVYGRDQDKQQQGRIVRVTLAELEQHNGEVIDEAEISTWLDRIYSDQLIRQQWEEEYQAIAKNADWLLKCLQPFDSSLQKEEEFEQLFDNVEVLPKDFEQGYVQCLTQGDFLEASNYLVSISTRKYNELKRKEFILAVAQGAEEKTHRWMVRLPYDEETGLSFDGDAPQKDPDWD